MNFVARGRTKCLQRLGQFLSAQLCRFKATADASGLWTYPDSVALNTQKLPKTLSQNLGNLFSNYPMRSLKHDGLALLNILSKRSAKQVETSTTTSEQQPVHARHDKYGAVLFAASRMPSCYAATRRVFHEIACRESDFRPQTLLDFGSGVGTTVWAAHSQWGDHIKEFQCIDTSQYMNEIAASLLRAGKHDTNVEWEETPPHIGNVYFKQYMPLSDQVCYDIVVSAYALEDVPTIKLRTDVIRALWKKASNFLVIIEPGTVAGFENILLSRDILLNTSHDRIPDWPKGYVYAPCTHDLPCPRKAAQTRKQCKFGQRAELSLAESATGLKASGYNLERFSYIVMRKRERPAPAEGVDIHRIVEPERKRTRHVVCKLCTQDGNLMQTVVSKSKGKSVYKHARSLKWGDLLVLPKRIPFTFVERFPPVADTAEGELEVDGELQSDGENSDKDSS